METSNECQCGNDCEPEKADNGLFYCENCHSYINTPEPDEAPDEDTEVDYINTDGKRVV